VVRIGLDYDLWLDKLTSKAANPAIVRGGKGLVDASGGITLLEVKTGGFGGDGHAHGAGNPHYWLDPENAVYITANITGALARVDPAGSKFYEQKRNEFLARLKTMIPVWQSKLAPLNGLPIVMYHNTWPYFGRRFRLNFAASIELKPGVPPSPSALASLLHRIREEHISVIVREPQEPSRDVDFLAEKTGSRVAVMAASIGDTDQARDYFSLFDANVAALVAAFSGHPK
jgi:ABC-type Zn uptake system ZnuABC Zn-binding protein ZnuA